MPLIKQKMSIDTAQLSKNAGSAAILNLINANPAQVGVAVIDGWIVFSNSANNFPLETRWNGKTHNEKIILEPGGHIVYQGWLSENFAIAMQNCTENTAFKNTDWEFAIQISAPYNAKVQPGKCGEIVENPTFGKESKYGCTMLWLRNKKTGELARLIEDETKWLSCLSMHYAYEAALYCPFHACIIVYGTDDGLWKKVRQISKKRAKELGAKKR
ncbi:MAG: hypothetical protein FWC61_01305 [Proteobacteria bacterium]|nr:hypothetical protein [Pseudomonadota bacterium]